MAKPKSKTTNVTFLLDRSGSMGAIKSATIEAFNAYLDELRKGEGISFSFLQFDSVSLDTIFKNVPIKDASSLTNDTFQPRGSTPLIDACVKTIKAVERALESRGDKAKVVICFQTDGQENCSREHTWGELNDLIKEKTKLGWQFNFMGASIDAYEQAQKMGLGNAQTLSYDSTDLHATRQAFAASAVNTTNFASGAVASTVYSGAQKLAAGDQFDPDRSARKPTVAKTPAPKDKVSIVDEPDL